MIGHSQKTTINNTKRGYRKKSTNILPKRKESPSLSAVFVLNWKKIVLLKTQSKKTF
jgi:hypothetical protein